MHACHGLVTNTWVQSTVEELCSRLSDANRSGCGTQPEQSIGPQSITLIDHSLVEGNSNQPPISTPILFLRFKHKISFQPIPHPNPDGRGSPISLSPSPRCGGLSTDPSSAWETNGLVPVLPLSFPFRCARPLPSSTCGLHPCSRSLKGNG